MAELSLKVRHPGEAQATVFVSRASQEHTGFSKSWALHDCVEAVSGWDSLRLSTRLCLHSSAERKRLLRNSQNQDPWSYAGIAIPGLLCTKGLS